MSCALRRISVHPLSSELSLVINGVTGAVDIMNNDIASMLKNDSIDSETIKEHMESLTDRGYLFSSPQDENEMFEKVCRSHLESAQSRPFQHLICPTLHCNFTCTYCYEENWDNKQDMPMSTLEHLFTILDQAGEQAANGRQQLIELFGGEPLLPRLKDHIWLIGQEAKKRKLPITIISNGYSIADHYVDWFKEFKDYMEWVQITVDGMAELHDRRRSLNGKPTFHQICNSIDAVLDTKVTVNMRVNLDSENVDSLLDLLNYVKDRGWLDHPHFTCYLAPVTDHALSGSQGLLDEAALLQRIVDVIPKHFPEYADLFQINNIARVLGPVLSVLNQSFGDFGPSVTYCEACNGEFLVYTPDGSLYACAESMNESDLKIGRFAPELEFFPVKDEWFTRSVLDIPECADCNIAMFCGGGCAYAAWKKNGKLKSPYCGGNKEATEVFLKDKTTDLLRLYDLLGGA